MVPMPRPEDRRQNQVAFETAARELLASHRAKALDSYPELATLKPNQS